MTDASITPAALEEAPLFHGLSPAGLEALSALMRVESFPPGTDILEAGKDTPGLFVLRSGTAAAIVTDSAGDEREVATLGRGECLGEMSLISGEPCSATVRAITETEAWLLPSDSFVELVQEHPDLWRNLGRVLAQRLARTSRHVGTASTSNLTALLTDLPPDQEVALAAAIAGSLARQTSRRALVVDATQDGASHPGQRLPSLAAITTDRNLLSEHQSSAPARDAAVCSLVDGTDSAISEGDVIAALDWLRPLYDTIIVAGVRSRDRLQALWHDRSRSLVVVVSEPAPGVPSWLHALLNLPDTARKLEIAVLTGDTSGPLLVQEIEDLRQKAVVRLPVPPSALTEFASNGESPPDRPEFTAAVDRLARLTGDFEIGLALGAGAAKGFAHIGVLRVLEEAGIPIDYIVGCSIGAVVGSQYAYGVPLDEIARGMHGADKKLTKWTLPLRSIWSNRGLKDLLSAPGPRVRFRDLQTPFAAVATDVSSGREVVLRKGIVWRAVMASTSVPGIFPPVLRGRKQMVDGGLVNPVPSQIARDMGADLVIAVDLMGPAARASEQAAANGDRVRVPNLVEMLWRANEIMQEEVTAHSAATADVTIEPRLGRVRWSDFSRRGRRFMDAGEAAAREKLPELLALLPSAQGGAIGVAE